MERVLIKERSWLITVMQIFVINIVKMVTFDVDPC